MKAPVGVQPLKKKLPQWAGGSLRKIEGVVRKMWATVTHTVFMFVA